jgi:hypothetical protein
MSRNRFSPVSPITPSPFSADFPAALLAAASFCSFSVPIALHRFGIFTPIGKYFPDK